MTTNIFENKEQYFAFRKAWADAVNNERAKKRVVERPYTIYHQGGESTYISKVKEPGWLSGAHHLLFNILCGRPYYMGFTPTTSQHKLTHSKIFNIGMVHASINLRSYVRLANKVINSKLPENEQRRTSSGRLIVPNDYEINRLNEFLEPFAGTVTIEQLANIQVPTIHFLNTSFGTCSKVRAKMTRGGLVITTYEELLKAIEEIRNED